MIVHLDYPDVNLRLFGDVDVTVVHPRSWDATLAALEGAGFRREQPELASGFDQRFGKGATLSTPDELEVDLHRRLAIGRFGLLLPTEELFVGGDSFTLGGRVLPALDPPRNCLLHVLPRDPRRIPPPARPSRRRATAPGDRRRLGEDGGGRRSSRRDRRRRHRDP